MGSAGEAACAPWSALPSAQSLTVASLAPVAKQTPLGAQEQAHMTRVCAFITRPSSLNGSPPSPAPQQSPSSKHVQDCLCLSAALYEEHALHALEWPVHALVTRQDKHTEHCEGDMPSGRRSKRAKVRSLETVSRWRPVGEKAIWVTVSACASSGFPTGVHVATSHSHTAANCAACACTPSRQPFSLPLHNISSVVHRSLYLQMLSQ